VPGVDGGAVLTADDVMAGAAPAGPVVVFDDDHYYMGGVVAEKLRAGGAAVTLVTPLDEVSTWTHNTLEYSFVQTRLREAGIDLVTGHNLAALDGEQAALDCVYTGKRTSIACATLVVVTARLPEDALYHDLVADADALAGAGIKSLTRIGDCEAPGSIAAAVYAGHRYARELDAPDAGVVRTLRERATV
jgi:dimethylamine/trimethylamine dehydrogenase